MHSVLRTAPSTGYYIRPGIYFVAIQGEGITMDLVRDRYYGFSAESARIWSVMETMDAPLDQEKVLEIASRVGLATEVVTQQLAEWELAELVMGAESGGLPVVPVRKVIGAPVNAGLDPARLAATKVSAKALLRLAFDKLWCRRTLKRLGISRTLAAIQAIPADNTASDARSDELLHRVVRPYQSFRRLHLQGRDDCLPRSLALATSLRRLGLAATVCIGVRKFPFSAHAWVEVGNRTVNESLERVRSYTMLARF